MTRTPFLMNPPLGDEGAGAGPPVASTQEDVELAEANDLVVHQSASHLPTFDDDSFEAYKMDDRYVSSRDNWIFSLLGKSLQYKELEFEDDLDFKARHPSNTFTIHLLRERLLLLLVVIRSDTAKGGRREGKQGTVIRRLSACSLWTP